MTIAWLFSCAVLVALYETACRRMRARTLHWPPARRLAWLGAATLAAFVVVTGGEVHPGGSLWIEAAQYAALAFGVAPLCAVAAPIGLARAAWGAPRDVAPGDGADVALARPFDKLGGLVALGAFLASTVAWRLPILVDALARHRVLLPIEAVTLVLGTTWLWVAVVGSPPWPPLDAGPWRIAFAAVGLWVTWIFAYAVGFSGHPFYPAYRTHDVVNQQELTVGLLWAASAISLVPTVFRNLVSWLGAEQVIAEAEAALYRAQSTRPAIPRPPLHRAQSRRDRGRPGAGLGG